MIRKIIFSFSFLFLLLIFSVNAEYLHVGDTNRDFLGGESSLDTLHNVTTSVAALEQYASMFVFVGDFNNDTVDEIAFAHENGVDLYTNTIPLTFVESYTSICSADCTTSRLVAMDALDIHDDGSPELVGVWLDVSDAPAGGYDTYIETIGSHKGSFTNITSKFVSLTSMEQTDAIIGCDDIDNDCAVIFAKNYGVPGCENARLVALSIWWNASDEYNLRRQDNEIGGDAGTGSGLVLEFNSVNNQCYYLPTLRSIAVVDQDNDGDREFIFSYLKLYTTGEADANVRYISLANDVNHTPIDEDEASYSTGIAAQSPMPNGHFSTNGQRNWSHIISPPLVGQFDTGNSPGLETYLSVATNEGSTDNWEFALVYFNDIANFVEQYPEANEDAIEGYLTSNVAKGTLFSTSDSNKDVCTSIYSNDNSQMSILCASQYYQTISGLGEHVIFPLNTSGSWHTEPGDLSLAIDFRHQIFALNANRSTARDEILSTYGVLSLETVNNPGVVLSLIGLFHPSLIPSPIQAVSLQFPARTPDDRIWLDDVDISGFDDLIYYDSPSVVLQLADPIKYGCGQNPPGNSQNNCIKDITIDPCTTEPILQNSTVHIFGIVEDIEADPLQVKAIIYVNDSNEQSSRWQNYSSGASFTIVDSDKDNALIFNKTGSFPMSVCVRDTDKPTSVYCIDPIRYHTVSAGTGNLRGDGCREVINVPQTDETTEFEDTSGFNENNNAVSKAVLGIATSANISVAILMNLFAVIIAFSIFFGSLDRGVTLSKSASFGMGAGALIMFIGAAFGLVSIAWVIIPLILGVFAFFVLPFFTPHTGGGG